MAPNQDLTLPEKIVLEMASEGDWELRQVLVWLNTELPGFGGGKAAKWSELRRIAESTIRSLIRRELIYLELRNCQRGNCEWLSILSEAVEEALANDEYWKLEWSDDNDAKGEDRVGVNTDVVLFTTTQGENLYGTGAALR